GREASEQWQTRPRRQRAKQLGGSLGGAKRSTAAAFGQCALCASRSLRLNRPVAEPLSIPEFPDSPFDISLRPPAFSEFAGQAKVRERVELLVAAATQRGDVLEHILLSGPPGL